MIWFVLVFISPWITLLDHLFDYFKEYVLNAFFLFLYFRCPYNMIIYLMVSYMSCSLPLLFFHLFSLFSPDWIILKYFQIRNYFLYLTFSVFQAPSWLFLLKFSSLKFAISLWWKCKTSYSRSCSTSSNSPRVSG